MRTTLDITDDVLLAAEERARREGSTAGRVISDLARESLLRTGPLRPTAEDADEPEEFFGFRPLPSRGVVVTNELIDRLRGELLD